MKTSKAFAAVLERARRAAPSAPKQSPPMAPEADASSLSDASSELSPPPSDFESPPPATKPRPKEKDTKSAESRFFSGSGNASPQKRQRPSTANEPTPEMSDLAPALIAADLQRSPGKPKPKSKAKPKPATKAVPKAKATIQVPAPPHWEEMYDKVLEMRRRVLAPVDTMGCERLAEPNLSARDKRFQTLISLMLSSQTKDTINAVAMKRLQTELPGGLCLESVLEVEPARLNQLIGVVGFHRRKTEYIKKAAVILKERHGGDIPDTVEGLVALPGVGPKMAHLCMSSAWDKTMGIGVDVHVHRITNLWGWNTTTTPEGTRESLESWLPREKWREINWLLVGFGQTICLPRGRKCGECLLSKGLCRAAFAGNSAPKRKKKVVKVKEEEEEEAEVEVEVESEESEDGDGEDVGDYVWSPRRSRRKRVKVEYVEEYGEDGEEDEAGDIEDWPGV